MTLTLITAPTEEPVSLPEAKEHLRVDGTDDDPTIQALVMAARQHAETFTRRALISQTWDWRSDGFPAVIEVPLPPLQSVTSLKYIDTAGVEQTLDASNYTVDSDSQPGRVVPAYGLTWPATRAVPNAVTLRFVAGYGATPDTVPEPVRQAIKIMIADWYENRETVVVGQTVATLPTVERLLWPYRAWTF